MEKTILELKKTQENQEIIIKSQAEIIAHLRGTVDHMRRMVNGLIDKTDELEQKLLADRLVLSGPAVDDFLKDEPGPRNSRTRNSERDEESRQRELDLQQMGQLDAELATAVRETNDPKVRFINFLNTTLKLDNSKKLEPSQLKFTSNMQRGKLLAAFHGEVPRVIFHNVRNTGRQLFCSDFLTAARSEIMADLRALKRDERNGIALVTSRNGCPMLRFSNERHLRKIETQAKLGHLYQLLGIEE